MMGEDVRWVNYYGQRTCKVMENIPKLIGLHCLWRMIWSLVSDSKCLNV